MSHRSRHYLFILFLFRLFPHLWTPQSLLLEPLLPLLWRCLEALVLGDQSYLYQLPRPHYPRGNLRPFWAKFRHNYRHARHGIDGRQSQVLVHGDLYDSLAHWSLLSHRSLELVKEKITYLKFFHKILYCNLIYTTYLYYIFLWIRSTLINTGFDFFWCFLFFSFLILTLN